MGKVKKMAYQIESGETIYIPQGVIKGITKTAYITKQFVEDGKLVIEYKAKNGSAHGVMEINDMEDIEKIELKKIMEARKI